MLDKRACFGYDGGMKSTCSVNFVKYNTPLMAVSVRILTDALQADMATSGVLLSRKEK